MGTQLIKNAGLRKSFILTFHPRPVPYPQVWQWKAQEGHRICDGKGGICTSSWARFCQVAEEAAAKYLMYQARFGLAAPAVQQWKAGWDRHSHPSKDHDSVILKKLF